MQRGKILQCNIFSRVWGPGSVVLGFTAGVQGPLRFCPGCASLAVPLPRGAFCCANARAHIGMICNAYSTSSTDGFIPVLKAACNVLLGKACICFNQTAAGNRASLSRLPRDANNWM